jgi:hypothetical protein
MIKKNNLEMREKKINQKAMIPAIKQKIIQFSAKTIRLNYQKKYKNAIIY